MIDTQDRTLERKMILLQDDRLVAQSSVAVNRINSAADYGYSVNSGRLQSLLRPYKNNGGIPELLYDAGLSVNWNLFTDTATLSTQTITLPVGTFTFGFLSGTGSITSSNGTGVVTTHGTATVGVNVTIVVTTAGTFTFTTAGVVNNAQLNVGSTLLDYRARTNATPVKSLNLGSTSGANDSTHTLGTSPSLIDSFGGEAFGASNILYADTGYTLPTSGPFSIGCWFRLPGPLVGNQHLFSGATAAGTLCIRIGSNKVQFLSAATAVIATSVTTLAVNTWYHAVLTIDASKNYTLYINGVSDISGFTALNFNANTLRFGARNAGIEPFTGSMNGRFAVNRVMSASEAQNIYNLTKNIYGY